MQNIKGILCMTSSLLKIFIDMMQTMYAIFNNSRVQSFTTLKIDLRQDKSKGFASTLK